MHHDVLKKFGTGVPLNKPSIPITLSRVIVSNKWDIQKRPAEAAERF
jgi:hypothetical protein